MTPKQKYDERKRLRIERELHDKQNAADRRNGDVEAEQILKGLMQSLERIADVMALWADMQIDGDTDGTV